MIYIYIHVSEESFFYVGPKLTKETYLDSQHVKLSNVNFFLY